MTSQEKLTSTLAKRIGKGLKADLAAESIRQNYKGTGSKKHRRQLWIRFKSGAVIDIWLEERLVSFGGVVSNGGGSPSPSPHSVLYKEKTPEQVYAEAMPILKAWADGGDKTEAVQEPAYDDGDEYIVVDRRGRRMAKLSVAKGMIHVRYEPVGLMMDLPDWYHELTLHPTWTVKPA